MKVSLWASSCVAGFLLVSLHVCFFFFIDVFYRSLCIYVNLFVGLFACV